jgi:hypothetical protein
MIKFRESLVRRLLLFLKSLCLYLQSISEEFMKVVKFPFSYYFKEIYPNAKRIGDFEGGAIYKAIKNGKYYLIVDEGTMADFIDEDDKELLDQLVKVIEFDTEEELNQYLREQYGKFCLFEE